MCEVAKCEIRTGAATSDLYIVSLDVSRSLNRAFLRSLLAIFSLNSPQRYACMTYMSSILSVVVKIAVVVSQIEGRHDASAAKSYKLKLHVARRWTCCTTATR